MVSVDICLRTCEDLGTERMKNTDTDRKLDDCRGITLSSDHIMDIV